MTFWIALLGFLTMAGIAAALNPIRALALAKEVGAFVIDKARAAAKWARDPARNWWKIGCLSFAGFFALASGYANSQRVEVVKVTDTYKAQLATLEAECRATQKAAAVNREAVLHCQAMLEAEVGLRQNTDRMNLEAVEKAKAQAAKAQSDLADFRRRQRSPSCSAALTSVEAACANLSDY